MSDNERLLRLGTIRGYGNVLGLMRDEGVDLNLQDKVHEMLDREHLRDGNTKREPRSRAVRSETGWPAR